MKVSTELRQLVLPASEIVIRLTVEEAGVLAAILSPLEGDGEAVESIHTKLYHLLKEQDGVSDVRYQYYLDDFTIKKN